jgi:hypothetical protein
MSYQFEHCIHCGVTEGERHEPTCETQQQGDFHNATKDQKTFFNALKKNSAFNTQVGGGHYKELAIQPLEYCQKNRLNMAESGVVKYVTRHKFKNGKEDILKAIHLLEMLLELEYPE